MLLMATKKSSTHTSGNQASLRRAKQTQRQFFRLIVGATLTVLLVLSAMYVNKAEHYKDLAQRDNLACIGIGSGQRYGLKPGNDYSARVTTGASGSEALFSCLTETVVTNSTQFRDGSSFAEGYELGATVMVFDSGAKAYDFAEQQINPQRWWSPGLDNEGALQTGRFTYIVGDDDQPYVDSYTTRGEAVISLSMRCGDMDDEAAFADCDERANKALGQFADAVQANLQQQPL
jgi:hypothetical protein